MNRRKLFGAIAGAAALPFVGRQKAAAAAPPSVWDGCRPMTEADLIVAFGAQRHLVTIDSVPVSAYEAKLAAGFYTVYPSGFLCADAWDKMIRAAEDFGRSTAEVNSLATADPNEMWAELDRDLAKGGL